MGQLDKFDHFIRAHDLINSQSAQLEELRGTFAEVVANNSSLKAEIETLKEAVLFDFNDPIHYFRNFVEM